MTDPLLQELISREIERTQKHGDPVIQRALGVLGQPINPVKVVDFETAIGMYPEGGRQLSKQGLQQRRDGGLGGFRNPADKNDPNLYITSSSREYKAAQNDKDDGAVAILAGMLVHEQTHNTDGESAAYRKESDFLRSKLDKIKPANREAVKKRIAMLDSLAAVKK